MDKRIEVAKTNLYAAINSYGKEEDPKILEEIHTYVETLISVSKESGAEIGIAMCNVGDKLERLSKGKKT